MTSYYYQTTAKAVRPLMSSDFCEARRRALGLYRAFYRYLPYVVKYYDIPKNEEDCRWKLRECFYKNAYITDVRVIDMLVLQVNNTQVITLILHAPIVNKVVKVLAVRMYDVQKNEEDCRWKLREYFYRNAFVTDLRVVDLLVMKGSLELKELTSKWASKHHVLDYWHPTVVPRPCSFLEKFFAGPD